MEENNETTKPTPGLPEALNPEIGNGALWEEDPHFFNLRSPDPSKSIENFLFDPDEKAELKKILTSNHGRATLIKFHQTGR